MKKNSQGKPCIPRHKVISKVHLDQKQNINKYRNEKNKGKNAITNESYLNNTTEKRIDTNNFFWKFIKPFPTKRYLIDNRNTVLTGLLKILMNFVEESCGNKPYKKTQVVKSCKQSKNILGRCGCI